MRKTNYFGHERRGTDPSSHVAVVRADAAGRDASGWLLREPGSPSCSTTISMALALPALSLAVIGVPRARRSSKTLSKIFEDYVVFVYTARLGDFGGEHIDIRGSRSDGNGVIVSTAISGPRNTSLVNVDWRLVTDNGAYKINDIIVEGISMGMTQRSEFASVVQRNGGQLRGLIALMREKTANAQ